jgi:tRNA-2-methylthio-N6-dimethylallyladenosine synthase
VREVTLLGQNVNGYRGPHHDGGICSFAELLRHVAEIPGIDRIRYTTSHPLEFSDELIAAYADIPQLVSHVHLPVQSGSDNVLAGMKRNHTAHDYRQRIAKLLDVRPDMHHFLRFHHRLSR